MKRNYLLFILLILFYNSSFGQWGYYQQYFDGNDTLPGSSIEIEILDPENSIWQIGPPQKNHFDQSFTPPNALITDTVNFYPAKGTWSFQFTLDSLQYFFTNILAFQWMQYIDFEESEDGGYIEFSTDQGVSWQNAFNNPLVYSFYGYNPMNVDTLPSGQIGFTGFDTSWCDLWLCFDASFVWWSGSDSLMVRFTSEANGPANNREGWMIDNMSAHVTFVHTIDKEKQNEPLVLSPNPSSGIVNLRIKRSDKVQVIEEIQVFDESGKVVHKEGLRPIKTWVDLNHLEDGIYTLRVKTNLSTETARFILRKDSD